MKINNFVMEDSWTISPCKTNQSHGKTFWPLGAKVNPPQM